MGEAIRCTTSALSSDESERAGRRRRVGYDCSGAARKAGECPIEGEDGVPSTSAPIADADEDGESSDDGSIEGAHPRSSAGDAGAKPGKGQQNGHGKSRPHECAYTPNLEYCDGSS